MSELRTKIAAGVTILALVGLGGVAMTHPQAPPPSAQTQAVGARATPAKFVVAHGFENEGADD